MSVRVRRVWLSRFGLVLPIWLIGCLAPPDEGVDESRLDAAGHLTTPGIMFDVLSDMFGPTKANVAIVPVKSGTTAAVTALGAGSQTFAALLQAAPFGFRDRIVARTEGIFAARTGTTLGGIAVTTSAAQQYICPVSGAFSSAIAGVTPASVMLQDVQPDAVDSVTTGLCGVRTLRTGTVLVSDGPVGRQWNGTSFVPFTLTGPGKFCISGDTGPACVAKNGAQAGTLAFADSRIQLGSNISLLQLDGIAPLTAGYPGMVDIHLVDKTSTDPREVSWSLYLDGDGTPSHPDHHAAFEAQVAARGLISVASF